MKKYVLKVAVFSFIGVIFLFSAIIFAISFFAPQRISQVCENVGFDNTALYYAEKAYLKDKSLDKCDYLLRIAIRADDEAVIDEYADDFLLDEELGNYFKNNNISADYYDFIASHYVLVSYEKDSGERTEFVYKAMTFSRDYRKGCAINAVINECFKNGDTEMLIAIKNSLNSFVSTNCPEERKADCKKTIDTIQLYLDRQ